VRSHGLLASAETGVSARNGGAVMGRAKCIGALSAALVVLIVAALTPATALSAGDINESQCPAETESSPGFRNQNERNRKNKVN